MLDLKPLPMEDAIQFWKDKYLLSPGQYMQLSDEAKNKAFAITGIAKGDELSTVFTALQKALEEGTTFDEFKKDAGNIFERRGWTGKAAWRTETIFRTNIQTAYNVGRYKEMMAVKRDRPYWQYSAINDSRTRPTHWAMNGKIFPADHPFWNTWYPPNGFNCRCGVVTLSQDDVDTEKLKVETEDPTGGLIEPVDPITGNKLPARPLMPDQGFAHNPGKEAWGFIDEGQEPGLWKDMPGLNTAAEYDRESLNDVDISKLEIMGNKPLAPEMSDNFYKAEFIKRYGEEKLLTDPINEPVILSLRSFLVDKAPGAKEVFKFEKAGHGESIPLLRDMVEAPYEIWLTPQKNDVGRIRLAKRYIALWRSEDIERIGGLAVFEVINGSFMGVTSFLPMSKGFPDISYLDKQRRGLLLYKK